MRGVSLSGPRQPDLPRARTLLRASWWKPESGCMRREWRPPYDPLPRPSRWTRFADVVWRFHSPVSSVSGRARRFSERGQVELADLAGDHGAVARPVRPGPVAASPLLAVGKVFRTGRLRLFVFL